MTFNRLVSGASLLLLLACGLTQRGLGQSGLSITEFMADNETTLRDDFGEFSDWIEIFNGADAPVNLNGYYLTDDPAQLTRWRFPATNLPPHRFLVVFASDRDRAIPGAVLHTNFKLSAAGEYLALVEPDGSTIVSQYNFEAQTAGISFGLAVVATNEVNLVPTGAVARVLVPTSNIGTTWIQPTFNDDSWSLSTAAIGFETNATVGTYAALIGTDLYGAMFPAVRASAYLRIPIVIDTPLKASDAQFQMQYDDGFAAYLNGREIGRRNAATNSTWNSAATAAHANSLAVLPENIPASGLLDALVPGTNYLAIHGLNRSATDADFLIRPSLLVRDTLVQPEIKRFFANPTPGALNSTGQPDIAGPVLFSHESGLVTNVFTLTLSVASPGPGAVIRYTLDRTVPTELSPAYTAPLRVTNTLQVRARLFEPGNLPGPVRSESYVFLHNAVLNFSSDLPLIVLHTMGGGIITDGAEKPGYLEIHDTFRGRSSLLDAADVKTRASAKVRGSSTGAQAKKALTVEFWDEANGPRDLSPLGLPPESDWILYPPNNAEPVLIHNPYVYQLYGEFGHYSVRTRFVELYLNESGGALSTTNYFGIYVLIEKIKIGPDRVNIDALKPSDRTAPDVTGGYLFKIDRRDPGDGGFNGAGADLGGIGPCYVDPKEAEIKSVERDAQEQYVTSFFNSFAAALNGVNYANPTNGYAKYLDVDRAIDYHLLNTLTFGVDANVLSVFFYKPRNGKITFGPPWDYDRSMGSLDPGFERDKSPRIWASQTYLFHMPWWDRMFSDSNFYQRWIDRYQELRRSLFSVAHLHELVDHFVAEVREAQVREVARWPGFTTPRTGTLSAAGGYTFNFGASGYQGEVEQMKHWLLERVNFIDGNFVGPPSLSAAGGPITAGFAVSLSGPAGATIYYTLDGSDPRLPGGSLNPRALVASSPITLNANTRVFARCRNPSWTAPTGGNNPSLISTWSGFVAESYYVSIPPLVLAEIMYHPVAPPLNSPFTAEDFEFVELKNMGPTTLSLKGVSFTKGIEFTFPERSVAAGASVLVVRNRAAFESRYGTRDNIAGEYTGELDNGGERLVLLGALGEPILDFVYDDAWYPITDGDGFSLVLRDESSERNTWNDPASWRVSADYDGSPGSNNPAAPAIASIVINEILTRPLPGGQDAVELFNPTLNPVDVSGWFLTEDADQPRKFQLRPGAIIPANGYLVLREQNLTPQPGQDPHFGLDRDAEEIFLFSADASGALTGYRTGTQFEAGQEGVSFGRYEVNPVLLPGHYEYPVQKATTLGGPNAGPKIGPIVISEIHYHPPDAFVNQGYWDAPENEFIELRNISEQDVDLYDPVYPANTWRLSSAVDFDFPAGFTLEPQGVLLLVNFDPATDLAQLEAFRARHALDGNVAVWGPIRQAQGRPLRGKLDNSSDEVRLLQPGLPNPTNETDVPYIVVDRVKYQDAAPWPLPADGYGFSLQRVALTAYGNDPGNWIAAEPTAGRVNATAEPAPSITQQPHSLELVGGLSGSFSVTATGSGASSLRYQWLRNGRLLSGQTASVLTLTNVSVADEAEYSVVVYVSGSFVKSAPASLRVLIPAQILVPPASQAVNPGSNVTFRVSATGKGTLRYRWSFNGEPIANATNATLTLTNVSLSQQGAYAVTVMDTVGAITSPPALLTVLLKPVIILQPQPTTAVVGDTVTLSFSAYGTSPFWYRWLRDATFLSGFVTNVATQLNAQLILTNVQLNQRAIYQLQFGNPAQTSPAFSTAVRLNVVADTDGDGIEDEWERALGMDPATAADAGLDPDRDGFSNLEEYRAGTNPNLATSRLGIESIINSGGHAVLTFATASNRTYSVQMREALRRGEWVTVTNIPARVADRLEVFTDPYPAGPGRWYRLVAPQQPRLTPGPIILASPSSAIVPVGTSAVLEVVAVGASALRYQWFRDGTPLAEQTGSRLSIPSVQSADAGLYWVTVSDFLGTTSSLSAQLALAPRP